VDSPFGDLGHRAQPGLQGEAANCPAQTGSYRPGQA
jgi:hypothetical protein